MSGKPTVLLVLLLLGRIALAQGLHGTARDSVTRRPVPGVVVTLLDSANGTLGRFITNERGEFRVPVIIGVHQLRAQRLGFRMREQTIPGRDSTVDIILAPLPSLLQPVRVTANANCPRNRREQEAFGLLEQARAGLLNTVVARETKPGKLVRLEYQRHFDFRGNVENQEVRRDTATSTVSFHAARTGADFVKLGFAGPDTTYGVDADVLLDDDFAAGYCFRISDPDKARANQVGLAFFAPRRKSGRVDIDGVLWIDTVSRTLRDMEFRYVGPDIHGDPPIGRTTFREMANGVVLIENWSAKLRSFEGGGILAQASWPDSTSYRAPLGQIRGKVRLNGTDTVIAGAAIRLAETNYVAISDSTGQFAISQLMPGPYSLQVLDPELYTLDILPPPSLLFTVVGDSIIETDVKVGRIDDYIWNLCGRDKFPKKPVMLLGRVMDENDTPIGGATVHFSHLGMYVGSGETGADGVFELCMSPDHDQDAILISVSRTGYDGIAATRVVGLKPTTLKIVIKKR
jgi:hypothetical protein